MAEKEGARDAWSVHLPRYTKFMPMEGDGEALERLGMGGGTIGVPVANTWSQPPAGVFLVRGPQYLSQTHTNAIGFKQPSAPAGYDCVGINVFRSSICLNHVSEQVQSLKEFLVRHEGVDEVPGAAPQFLLTSFLFSNWRKTEYTVAVHLFKRKIPIAVPGSEKKSPTDLVWERFLAMETDEERSQVVKFMCRIVDANVTLRGTINMLGGERPVIIGKKLTTKYHFGKNCLEISHDVGSSQIASMLCGVMLQNSGAVVLDYAWGLEAQHVEELPEHIMAICRWNWCTAEECHVKLDAEGFAIDAAST